MKSLMKIALIGLSAVVAGCSTINSSPYKASTSNVIAIQQALASTDTQLNVGTFTLAAGIDESPNCRLLGPVDVTAGKSVSIYIKEAFEEELFLAKAYDPRALVSVNGVIERLTFSSVSPASWDIALRVSTAESAGFTSAVNYRFNTSFDAFSACQNVANAFGPAVQELLKRVVTDPQFARLAGTERKRQ